MLEDFPEVMTGRSMIPEANNLFQVRPEEDQKLLDKEQATESHHTVAQLLFVMPRAKKDTNMDINFL